MVVGTRRLTLEEFLRLPEREPALEFDDGVVTQKVSPKAKYSRLQGRLARLIEAIVEPPRVAVVAEAAANPNRIELPQAPL